MGSQEYYDCILFPTRPQLGLEFNFFGSALVFSLGRLQVFGLRVLRRISVETHAKPGTHNSLANLSKSGSRPSGPFTVNPIKLETGVRPNSAGIPYTLLLRIEAMGFPTFGLLL